MEIKKQRKYYLIVFIILFLSAFIIPYFVIDHIKSFRGPFLFWIIYVLTTISLTFLIINKWRD